MSVSEQELEERAVAPRVTLKDVEDAILFDYYFTAADGVRGSRLPNGSTSGKMIGKAAGLELLTFCVLVMKNGFTCVGKSYCVDPANYQADIAERLARTDAENAVWELLGYELKTKRTLAAAGVQ